MTPTVKLTHLCIQANTESGDMLTVLLDADEVSHLAECLHIASHLRAEEAIDGILCSVTAGMGPEFLACEASPESASWDETGVAAVGEEEAASLGAARVRIECAEWIVEPDAVEVRFLQRHGDSWYRNHIMWSGPLAEAVGEILKEV